MAGSDIYVTFGGDTAGLEASAAAARASINALANDMRSLARQMQATGASADSELGQKMLATAAKLVDARAGLAGIKGDLTGLAGGAGFAEVGAAAEAGAAAIRVSTRSIIAGVRGFAELAEGQTHRAATSFVRMAISVGAANPALVGIGAAALAAAGEIGYLAYQGVEAGKAVDSIKAAALAAQLDMPTAEAAKLRDTIKDLAGVSNSAAAEIARAFLAIGEGAPQVAQIASAYLPQLAAAMGEKAPEAAKKLAEMFAELGTKGRAYVAETNGVSAATIAAYDGYVAAGQSGKAYSTIIDAMISRLEGARDAEMTARAAAVAHQVALGAAQAGVTDLSAIERAQAQVVGEVTQKYDAANAALRALQGELAASTATAKEFARALDTAMRFDKVGAEVAKTTGEIRLMQTALAEASAKGDATGAAELTAGIARAADSLKKLQQEAADGLLGRDAVAQTEAAIAHLDATWKGSTTDRLIAERAAWQKIAADAGSSAEQIAHAQAQVEAKTKEIDASGYRDFAAAEDVKVAAAGKASAQVVAIREEEVARARAVFGAGSDEERAAIEKLAQAKEKAAERGAAAAAKGGKDELAATLKSGADEVAEIEKSTSAKVALYAKEAQAKQITEAQKVASTLAALQQGETAEQAALRRELAIDGLSLAQKQTILDKERDLQLDYALAVAKIQEDAAAKTQQAWISAEQTIASAATSQTRGLLTGQESWRTAFKNVLLDMTVKAIDFFVTLGVKAVGNAALQIAENNSVVASFLAGLGLQTAAQTSSAAAGTAAVVAAKAPIIVSDSGQAGAGVAAFLAPFIGPAAIPAGSAAAASVLAIGSADIGMWNVPSDRMTLIHERELVMPAAEAGAFRDMLSGGAAPGGSNGRNFSVSPTTHINIHSMDGATVASTLMSNNGAIMKAIDRAVRDGAHLGLRKLSR